MEDAIADGIRKVLVEWLESGIVQKTILGYRGSISQFFSYYEKANSIKINYTDILPRIRGKRFRTYKRVFDLETAASLILELLNDHSTFFDEHSIMDFRRRRALIIQLETAARAHEIMNLKRECLRNYNGMWFLHLHKTKTGKERYVHISEEVAELVKELQSVSYPEPIFIDSKKWLNGDGKTEHRLLASYYGGPFSPDGLNDMLAKIQDGLWKDEPNPNGEPFTSHDMRALSATYWKIIGKDIYEIAEKLGQDSVFSQLPYTATAHPDAIEALEKMVEEGLWTNLTNKPNENTLDASTVFSKTKNFIATKEDQKHFTNFVMGLMEQASKIEFAREEFGTRKSGFPMGSHNCTAHVKMNCGSHELNCFGCDDYKPDEDKWEDHLIMIFCYLVLVLRDQVLSKEGPAHEREFISIRTEQVQEEIQKAFSNLTKKFGRSVPEVKKTEKDLVKKAKRYIKQYYQTNPEPSFREAKKYLKEGGL